MGDATFSKFMVLMMQGRYAQAEAEAREMIGAEPEGALAYGYLVDALRAQDKLSAALDAVQRAIELSPDSSMNLYRLGSIELSLGRYRESLEALDRALELDPSDADFHHARAVALVQLDRNQEALAAAEAGLAIDAEHDGCRTARNDAMHALGYATDAKADLYRQLEKDPNSDVVHCRLGEALLLEGKTDDAAQHFREALRIDPEFARARSGLVEAMKARSFFYSLLLRFGYWLSTMPRSMVLIGMVLVVVGPMVLDSMLTSKSVLGWIVFHTVSVVVLITQLPLLADALSTLILRLDKRNRIILSNRERRVSNWQIAPLILLGLMILLYPFNTRFSSIAAFCVLPRACESIEYVLAPPSRRSRRRLWVLYAAGVLIGLLAIILPTPACMPHLMAWVVLTFQVDLLTALKWAVWGTSGLFLLSLYGCFEVVEQWSPKLVVRDRLGGETREGY